MSDPTAYTFPSTVSERVDACGQIYVLFSLPLADSNSISTTVVSTVVGKKSTV